MIVLWNLTTNHLSNFNLYIIIVRIKNYYFFTKITIDWLICKKSSIKYCFFGSFLEISEMKNRFIANIINKLTDKKELKFILLYFFKV